MAEGLSPGLSPGLIGLALAGALAACGAPVEELPPCTTSAEVILAEDFEVATLDDLFAGADGFTQGFVQNGGDAELIADPEDPANQVLRAFGPSGDGDLVKANLQKKGLCFSRGDVVAVEARHYIASGPSLAEVFLVDIECEVCGDQNPGPRLQLKEADGFLRFDRGKLGLDNLELAEVGLPRDRWFTLRFEVTVGDDGDGRLAAFIDDAPIIDASAQSAPDHMRLDNVQVALTASASPDAVDILIDDVRISLVTTGIR